MINNDLPNKLSNPARRALAAEGCQNLTDLSRLTEDQVRQLHGIGPKALDQLRIALREKGLWFAKE